MNEIMFQAEPDPEGGFLARAMDVSIFTQAAGRGELKTHVRDAVLCHFPNPEDRPRVIRMRDVREEVFTL